jgi:outer membrane lipoprotein SlyB
MSWPRCFPTVTGGAFAQEGVQQTIRYAQVMSMEKTTVKVRPSTTGTQVGATAGAVAGYALASSGDRWLGGLLGGVLGGAAGRAADKRASKKKGWQLIVKLEGNGEEIGVQVVGKKVDYKVGDRVRLLAGPGGQTQVSLVEG